MPTIDQLAEQYDMARNSVIYRRKHGIPMDKPKKPGNHKSKGAPKGVTPSRLCECGQRFPIRSKTCTHCGIPAVKKVRKMALRQ